MDNSPPKDNGVFIKNNFLPICTEYRVDILIVLISIEVILKAIGVGNKDGGDWQ